jgi:hypothetical protein
MLKLCRECKYSVKVPNDYGLRCASPEVNSSDPWALSSSKEWAFTDCRAERGRKWFAVCGIKGKKWEKKVD